MKLSQLNEDTYKHFDKFEEVKEGIKRDCEWFLDVEVPLYRGVKSLDDYFYRVPRTDRTPRDTDTRSSNIFDQMFYDYHGLWEIRKRTAFATTNKKTAGVYGNEYYVFPTDDCKIIITHVDDTTNKLLDDLYYRLWTEVSEYFANVVTQNRDSLDMASEFMDELEHNASDLPHHEDRYFRDAYKDVIKKYHSIVAIEKMDILTPREFSKIRQYRGKDIEFMILGPFYAIATDLVYKYDDLIDSLMR